MPVLGVADDIVVKKVNLTSHDTAYILVGDTDKQTVMRNRKKKIQDSARAYKPSHGSPGVGWAGQVGKEAVQKRLRECTKAQTAQSKQGTENKL